eukprot:Colp12_sorted_trinity150504_noHs@13277
MASAVRRLKPLFDRVLIERVEAATKTKGGILLPEAAVDRPVEGIVVAVGPGQMTKEGTHAAMSTKVGDRVLLPDFGGNKVKIGDKEFTLFKEQDLLGVFEH